MSTYYNLVRKVATMRTAFILSFIFAISIFLFFSSAYGQNSPFMWTGKWTLYDGNAPYTHTLSISDTKADCMSPAWCSLVITLKRDTDGKRWRGRIETIDDAFRHMVFYIGSTKYDAQIFVGRKKIGVRVYHRKPSYFFAVKR